MVIHLLMRWNVQEMFINIILATKRRYPAVKQLLLEIMQEQMIKIYCVMEIGVKTWKIMLKSQDQNPVLF